MLNLVTLTKPLLENFEDDRNYLIQQCTDAEKKVHQNVEKLRDSEETTCRSRNMGQNKVLVNHFISPCCILYILNCKITIGKEI